MSPWKAFGLVLSIVGGLLASARTVEACSCGFSDVDVPCELYGKAQVAFVGRAVKVPPGAGGIVRFQVLQAFKGVAAGEVSVLNDDSRVGCGYQFEEGWEYLVFASRNKEGAIQVRPCSFTVWKTGWKWSASAPAVTFLASLRRAPGGFIYGEVERTIPPGSASAETVKTPVDGASVILRGGGQERRTTTVQGRYEFLRVPPGVYTVSVAMPAGSPPARSTRIPEHPSPSVFRLGYQPEPTRSVTITPERSCGYAPFEAVEKARPR